MTVRGIDPKLQLELALNVAEHDWFTHPSDKEKFRLYVEMAQLYYWNIRSYKRMILDQLLGEP